MKSNPQANCWAVR